MINSNNCRNNALLYKRKGTLLSLICNYSEALECFDKAIKIDKNDSDSYY